MRVQSWLDDGTFHEVADGDIENLWGNVDPE
jgi:hypothetical protein